MENNKDEAFLASMRNARLQLVLESDPTHVVAESTGYDNFSIVASKDDGFKGNARFLLQVGPLQDVFPLLLGTVAWNAAALSKLRGRKQFFAHEWTGQSLSIIDHATPALHFKLIRIEKDLYQLKQVWLNRTCEPLQEFTRYFTQLRAYTAGPQSNPFSRPVSPELQDYLNGPAEPFMRQSRWWEGTQSILNLRAQLDAELERQRAAFALSRKKLLDAAAAVTQALADKHER